jgi:beta-galactosidase
VFVNGKQVGTLDRRLKQDSLTVTLPKGQVRLEVLVENLGRINFGKYLLQNRKGITEKVVLGGKEVKNWQMFGLPFERADASLFKAKTATTASSGPLVKRGTFTLAQTGDTYLDMRAWGKGSVWINGHSLGRYWQVGPQQTLYVPVEWLKKGENEVVVLELLKPEPKTLQSLAKPILNSLPSPAVGKLN